MGCEIDRLSFKTLPNYPLIFKHIKQCQQQIQAVKNEEQGSSPRMNTTNILNIQGIHGEDQN